MKKNVSKIELEIAGFDTYAIFNIHLTWRLIFAFLLFTFYVASGQQLQSYINQAQTNNPKIKAYELQYNIAQEKIKEANWIPNTELGVGYFVGEPETRTGAQRARFSARQMLPWFGTVSTRQKYAAAMAETDYVEYIIAKRKIALAEKVLEDTSKLLKTHETVALNAVKVGNANAVDVLRLQIRQNQLDQEKLIVQQQITAAYSTFSSLLNKNTTPKFDTFSMTKIPDTDPVMIDSLQINPELLRFDKMYDAVSKAEVLNQKDNAPVLGVGLDYIPVQERPNLSFDDNGKDIVMPMVSLSIPIFSSRSNSRSKQHKLHKQEIELQKQERLNVLTAKFAQAVSHRNEARIAYNTQIKNLKQAKDTEQILTKSYEIGTINFEEILDIQELQLTFQKNIIQSIKKYYVQSAIINYLSNQ